MWMPRDSPSSSEPGTRNWELGTGNWELSSLRCALDLFNRARPRTNVLRRRPDEPGLALLLEDVRGPAGHARGGEHRREEVRRDAGEVEHHGGPELHIRGEHAVGL